MQLCLERWRRICARVALDALLGGPSTSPLAQMQHHGIKRLSLYGAVGVSFMVGIYAGWMGAHNLEPTDLLLTLYSFVLILLLATWLIADNRQLGRTQPTFDYGWFILIACAVYIPYYLFSTRSWRGVLMLVLMALSLFLALFLGAVVGGMFVSWQPWEGP